MENYRIKVVFKSGLTIDDTLRNYSYSNFRYLVEHNEVKDVLIYE